MTAKSHRGWSPLIIELEAAPELAVLAVIRAAADVLTSALLAANPHLTADPDLPTSSTVEIRTARRVIAIADRLCTAIDAYRAACDTLRGAASPSADLSDDDDIPF